MEHRDKAGTKLNQYIDKADVGEEEFKRIPYVRGANLMIVCMMNLIQ